MKELIIEKTNNTPGVEFNAQTGYLKIEGRSIPENPGDFFDRLLEWIEQYYRNPADVTRFDLNLEYVNSGSSKYLLGIFRMLKKKQDEGYQCTINWYYEEDDEAIFSLGEHYKTSVRLPFNLIEFIQ
ncbi:MAG: DUF1987 domain-containing protein [Bacteroidales bacterium]|nr:DUF1987 domain-containing protein [Bacteroidales bacterium]MBN2764700.1 DUF1987 domain-containing protein [Bacteroidales bacterium]